MAITESPLSRDAVVTATPVLKAVVGLAFIAFSAGATVTIGGDDLKPWLADSATIGLFADRYWLAALVAAGITLGQVVTRGKAVAWYGFLLIIDAIYTGRQVFSGFLTWLVETGLLSAASGPLVLARPAGPSAGQIVAAWLLAVLLGIFIARQGENLVFGKPAAKKTPATRK